MQEQAHKAKPLQIAHHLLRRLLRRAVVQKRNHHRLVETTIHQRRDDLLCIAALDRPVARLAVQLSEFGEQEPDVICQLRHRAHGGAGVFHRIALIDRNRRRNAFHALHLRLIHAVQKLPRISRKALDIAPLSLGVEGVERQARLARSAHPGDNNEFVDRYVEMQVFEIILASPNNTDDVCRHRHPRRGLEMNAVGMGW